MSERAVIDLSKVGSKDDLHRLLKGMLLFPDHYGANLDALHDMLTERHRELILTNTADTSDELKDYLPRLLKVLEDSSRENEGFTYSTYEGDMPSEDEDTSAYD